MSVLVILVAMVAVGYFVSLRIHPLKRCRTCKMQGRHFGSVYSYAYRRCRTCGGTGRQDRLGVKLFFGGTKDTGVFPRRLSLAGLAGISGLLG
jgi:DnaJ-class molecular chaperone